MILLIFLKGLTMEEVLIKTHLIVTDVQNEYDINWCGKIIDSKPLFKNNKPVFVIVGSEGRLELNTTDMTELEKWAKKYTQPHGRSAVSTDSSRIYLVEEDGNEKLLGIVTHNRIKKYAQMMDKVGWQ